MDVRAVFFLISVCLLTFYSVHSRTGRMLQKQRVVTIVDNKPVENLQISTRSKFCTTGRFFSSIIVDALELNLNLFSVDSAKIITSFLPLYTVARVIDEDLQCCFHNQVAHRNKNQLPRSCHKVAQAGVSIPMVGLSSLWLFGWNDQIRETARLTAIGLPFVHWGKHILKPAHAKACLRPWHEDFGHDTRSAGGFPSGHMANVTYMATLWGIRHGARWAVPLGLFASFVMVDFINCNRHYVSQLLAGAGVGVLYAVAANKVINRRVGNDFSLGITAHPNGQTAMQVAYAF